MKTTGFLILILTAPVISFFLGGCGSGKHDDDKGWGLSPRVVHLKSDAERERYEKLFSQTEILWLRTRMFWRIGQNQAHTENLSWFGQRGFLFLGLVPQIDLNIKGAKTDPNDLMRIYRLGRKLAQDAGTEIGAWENFNEPDIGFRSDLPDSSSAFMKTWYLALKSVQADQPEWSPRNPKSWGKNRPVIGPSMSLPPGPWMNRAARNGLFEYCDAANFHFYGDLRDFADVIAAHRFFLRAQGRPGLPLWLTEVGNDSVPADDLDQEEGRLKQAAFFRGAAAIARQKKLAAFFPYALTEDKLPALALLDARGNPYPAWTAYAELTRRFSLQAPAMVQTAAAYSPVVMQWIPEAGFLPHKVSGTYRFARQGNAEDSRKITGKIRIYNFSAGSLSGNVEMKGLCRIEMRGGFSAGNAEVVLPPMSTAEFLVEFVCPPEGYLCERVQFTWQTENQRPKSVLYFGLETSPDAKNFTAHNLTGFSLWDGERPVFAEIEKFSRKTSQAGCWTGINGLEIEELNLESDEQKTEKGPSHRGRNASEVLQLKSAADSGRKGGPPMAIMGVRGLPSTGFLRLSSDRPFDQNFFVRVDLVDRRGQRFTIFENSGMSLYEKSREVWLNLADFHLYFWGRCLNPDFDPSSVREIQLRPYLQDGTGTLRVELMMPKEAAPQ